MLFLNYTLPTKPWYDSIIWFIFHSRKNGNTTEAEESGNEAEGNTTEGCRGRGCRGRRGRRGGRGGGRRG